MTTTIPVISFAIPDPAMTQIGDSVVFEWHFLGLTVDLGLHPSGAWALIDDALRQVPHYCGSDPHAIDRAVDALRVMERRYHGGTRL